MHVNKVKLTVLQDGGNGFTYLQFIQQACEVYRGA